MEKQQKEYGKLSLDQFQQIVRELPEIRSQMQSLPELIRAAPKEKINAVLDQGIYWAMVYELSFHKQMLLESIGNIPPAEFEMAYYRQLSESADAA